MANWVQLKNNQEIFSKLRSYTDEENENLYFANQAIQRLTKLQQKLVEQEKDLYKSLGVKTLSDLQRRIYALNADTGFRSLVNLPDSEFDNIVMGAASGINPTNKLVFVLDKGEGSKNIENIAKELVANNMMDIKHFLKELRSKTKTGKGIHISSSSEGGSRGFGKKIASYNIIANTDPVELEIKLAEGSSFSKKDCERLEELLQGTLKTEDGELRTRLKEIFLDKIKNDELKKLVADEFDKDWYDVNSSKASIKGFLGEIHAYTAMKYLFRDKANTAATGNIRDLKGQEIPIDLVVNNIGFQIKNYRIENGEAYFPYGGQAGNFIENRIRPEQSLGDLLATFFGLYAYNIDDKVFQKSALSSLSSSGEIPKIFNAHMDNIMRFSDVFQNRNTEQKLFGEHQLYFNTFFLIADKLVPASYMIEAIIMEIKNQRKSIFNTTWKFTAPTGSVKANEDPIKVANDIRIQLYLRLNVVRVLKMAPKIAERKTI